MAGFVRSCAAGYWSSIPNVVFRFLAEFLSKTLYRDNKLSLVRLYCFVAVLHALDELNPTGQND